MTSSPVVALLTDFGVRDPFVGVMKCVILSRCPGAQIVDLTHEIEPQAVAAGAFWLSRSVPWLPPAATCIAVVDPGVGGSRRAVVVVSGGRVFVGPDNGILGEVAGAPGAESFAIELGRIGLASPSATFHGRDVFAPLAAEIAAGRLWPAAVGPRVEVVASPLPAAIARPGEIAGEVIVVDRFGNLITNVCLAEAGSVVTVHVEVGGREVPWGRTYSDVEVGALVALENAFGVVEIACRDASAAAVLGAGPGAAVRLCTRPKARQDG